jgi:hypothetical protein
VKHRISNATVRVHQPQRESILAEWETFARRLGPITETMDIEALRDHASEMLTVIAGDLDTPQTERRAAPEIGGQGAGRRIRSGDGGGGAWRRPGGARVQHRRDGVGVQGPARERDPSVDAVRAHAPANRTWTT